METEKRKYKKRIDGDAKRGSENIDFGNFKLKIGVLEKKTDNKTQNCLISTITFIITNPDSKKRAEEALKGFHQNFIYNKVKPLEKPLRDANKELNDIFFVIEIPEIISTKKNTELNKGKKQNGYCSIEIYFNFKKEFRYLYNSRYELPQVKLAEKITMDFIVQLEEFLKEMEESFQELLANTTFRTHKKKEEEIQELEIYIPDDVV